VLDLPPSRGAESETQRHWNPLVVQVLASGKVDIWPRQRRGRLPILVRRLNRHSPSSVSLLVERSGNRVTPRH
jgi:hypothetical protein